MKHILIFFMICISPLVAVAELSVTIEPNLNIPKDTSFKEDYLQLVVKKDGQLLEVVSLYSSYGKATSTLVYDNIGTPYILVRHGKGRGTRARKEFLTVYAVGNQINEVLRVPLSGPAGIEHDWEYRYEYHLPDNGGLLLALSQNALTQESEYVPEYSMRVIRISIGE